jgi:anti-sigma factor RsiW
MQGNCHKASEIDLATFLAEPASPEWEEFRQHYPRCESCSAEVYKWTKLERIFRAMDRETTAPHPSEERLVQFQQSPGNLAPEERQTIQQHLQTCPACREELSLLASFDFSLIQRWVDEEKPARVVGAERPIFRESLMTRLLGALRSLVLHPAFAYGVALLLGIRVASRDLLPHSSSGSDFEISPPAVGMRAGPERSVSPGSTTIVVPSSLSPHEAAVALLGAYKAAYEARDMSALDRLWKMSGEWHTTVAQLFEESRRLSLLLDVRSVRVNDEGNQVSVEFAQVTTVLSKEGRFYTKGPVSYTADIRRRGNSSGWEIQNLQHMPD